MTMDMRTVPDMSSATKPVSLDLYFEMQQFLFREARLLDAEDYEAWLTMLAPDIHYWMPGIQARYRSDKAVGLSPNRMAFFDDDLDYLEKRVARARQKSAWAEDPATRHFHLVSNVEVEVTAVPDEWIVHSLILNIRHRNEAEELMLSARRTDVVRREPSQALKLAKRTIILQQTVLQAKNINTFL